MAVLLGAHFPAHFLLPPVGCRRYRRQLPFATMNPGQRNLFISGFWQVSYGGGHDLIKTTVVPNGSR